MSYLETVLKGLEDRFLSKGYHIASSREILSYIDFASKSDHS